jgi:hypothetical protein
MSRGLYDRRHDLEMLTEYAMFDIAQRGESASAIVILFFAQGLEECRAGAV